MTIAIKNNLFIEFFDLGILVLAPFEVKLWPDGPSREPDILFIGQENLSKLTSERFEGGPDLIIEIISPSSVTEDRVHKFTEYARVMFITHGTIGSKLPLTPEQAFRLGLLVELGFGWIAVMNEVFTSLQVGILHKQVWVKCGLIEYTAGT